MGYGGYAGYRSAGCWIISLIAGIGLGTAVRTAEAQEIGLPPGVDRIPAISSTEIMQRPTTLDPGAGRMHQQVSTNSSEAQAFYDQGIAFLHSYVWVEAARSFHEALRRDPGLAMAELGLAKAYFNSEAMADAFDHMKKAAVLAAQGAQGKITPKEAKWIEIGQKQWEAIFAAPQESQAKLTAYRRAIEELIAMDPDDAHAWVLAGNAAEARATGRGQGGRVPSIAYYEAALYHDPSHWGANHYLIHSYEGLGQYEKSGENGAKYAAAVSGVPHAQHMYAHVLPRLGKWQEALSQLGRADELQREYFERGIPPVEEWHHGHNIHLMGSVQLRLGNDAEAERLLREAFYLEVRSLRDGRFTDPWLEYLLLRGRNEEALRAAREAQQRPLALARFIGSARAAEALLALGRTEEARRDYEQAKTHMATFRSDVANHPMFGNQPRNWEDSLLKPLEAQFALVGPNPQEGEDALLKHADGYLDETGFDGWVTGLFRLEQLAGVAQRAGRPQLARALLERIQQIDPDYVPKLTVASAAGPGSGSGRP
jgi:tetratricopeptide (TPR) repeat protein